ncbi:MAG: RNA-binding cell elongation regulator Jag/EloR [Desulfatiglandaceae bacterium]|jgi:spoIIIJ-associated protein
MSPYEFEGKTTNEAIEAACEGLKVSEDKMSIEILEPGSAGIFGLVGGRKARIKVSLISEERAEEAGPEKPDENDLTVAKETLEKLLGLIPIEATVTSAQQNGKITLSIEGDSSGLLIGRRGRTLDALQYIVNKIVNKALEKHLQVIVDSESYRQRRSETLTEMAMKMGEKAKKMKKPVSTNLLNPHDRRIVHLTLRDDKEVDTRSRGEGILKKVVIIPKR